MDKKADSSGENRQDKGSKNKRKLGHPAILPTDAPSSLIEFPRYELPAEISQCSQAEFMSSEIESDWSREEPEVQMHELADWNDPIAIQLGELLLSNLQAVFRSAIRQIFEFGYSEDVAEKAISTKSLYVGEEDPVSTIVHDTLKFLKGNDITTRDVVFENSQHLLHYTMVEMISVLQEVRSSLTVSEAMWLLLICDLDISQACAMEEDCLNGFVCKDGSSTSSSDPQQQLKVESSNMILSNCSTANFLKDSSTSHHNYMSGVPKLEGVLNSHNSQSLLASEGVKLETEYASLPKTTEKSSGTSGECAQVSPQLSASESKSGPSSKRHYRKEIAALRQKFLYMEKTYRASGKGGLRPGKGANIGNFVVEKGLKPPSKTPNQHMTCGSSHTISTQVPAVEGMCHVPVNVSAVLPAGDSSTKLPSKDEIATSPVVNVKTSSSDKKFKTKFELRATDAHNILYYCAGIPYNESLGKYVPRDQKDELILKLVHRMQKLQDELQSWNNWANQKVKQVAGRLCKEQAELKMLRKEKQEADLLKKEKKILEENALKRISEMENAVANTQSQIESADAAAWTLEMVNSLLKKELGAAKLWAIKSMASHQQALEREQMARKKAQSWEWEMGLLLDELGREKNRLAKLQQELDKEKNLQAKVEGRLEQEKVAKQKLLTQAALIKKERKQLGPRATAEEDIIRKKAANGMQKYVEDITKLEKELAELKLKSESAKIAALWWGIDGRNDSCSRNSKILRREWECVMCLSEEMSMVFLPCAHQVVCAKCNELHEKQGMMDCPSCRTPIQQRIHALFAGQL